jgi:uncharacterized protein YijF (DUF1287 family)
MMRAVPRVVHSTLWKLRLPETEDDHRRLLAVLTFFETRERAAGTGPTESSGFDTNAAARVPAMRSANSSRASRLPRGTCADEFMDLSSG